MTFPEIPKFLSPPVLMRLPSVRLSVRMSKITLVNVKQGSQRKADVWAHNNVKLLHLKFQPTPRVQLHTPCIFLDTFIALVSP